MSGDSNKEVKEQDNEKINILKPNFFKKLWYSITKIEKYPEMAAQGLANAIKYISKLVIILAIILGLGIIYKTNNLVQDGVNYLQNQFPEFSYKDNKLTVNSESAITIAQKKSIIGKIIVDTNTDDERKINEYINDINENGQGCIILKNKVILKSQGVAGNINYEYSEIFSQVGITEFTKQDVINYVHSSQIVNLYASEFLTIFVYSFIMYFLTTLSNAIFLSLFGYLTTWIAKIKMRFVAIFNMSVYALTLSTILNIIYIAINTFTKFNMQYFQVMYISVAAIYLVAAIFILKVDFTKKQAELMKIAEAQELVKKQLEEKEAEEAVKKEKEKQEKKDEESQKPKSKEKKNKKEDDNTGEEPEGSNA